MAKDRRRRADGTEIDPVKDLEEFAQTFEPSAVDEQKPPDVREMVLTGVDDPTLEGKKVSDIIAQAKRDAAEADSARQRESAANARTAQIEQQAQIAETVRHTLAEEQRRQQQQPEPVKVDPRQEKLDELWFTDPPAARKLYEEILAEARATEIKAAKEDAKRETLAEIDQRTERRDGQSRGEQAYTGAITQLQALGVSPESINRDRVIAVYAAITRPPTADAPNPYYDAGGPLNQDVIVRAWWDLYGAPPPAAAPPQQRVAPVQIPVAPPGSSRPAPAANPGRTREVHLNANESRDIEHLANQFGYDPEKMKARRRARLAAEGDTHA